MKDVPVDASNDWQPEVNGDWGVRVWFPDIMKEGEWHHLVFVFNRQVLKNSSFTLYVNGQQTTSTKMHYINQNPGENYYKCRCIHYPACGRCLVDKRNPSQLFSCLAPFYPDDVILLCTVVQG